MRALLLLLALPLLLVPAALGQSSASDSRDARRAFAAEALARPALDRPAVQRTGGLTFYATRSDFDAANPALPVEDFEDVHVAPAAFCASFSPVAPSTDDDCYDPGTLMAPLGLAAAGPTQTKPDAVIALGAGYFGQPSTVVGANLEVDTTEIRFDPGVYAAGMEVYAFFGNAGITVDVYDTGGSLLGSTTISGEPGGTFFGVRSDGAAIGAIQLDAPKDYTLLDDVAAGTVGGALTFDPATLAEALEAGQAGTETVTITNTAGEDVAYDVSLSTAPSFVTAVTPATGTIPAGGSIALAVTFDATPLIAGTYVGSLVVETDLASDPDAFVLPVTLAVTGTAACALTTGTLTFDGTIVGTSSEEEVTVENTGTDSCALTGASADGPFSAEGFEAAPLVPGASVTFTLVYTPTGAGDETGTLTVATDGGDLTAALAGFGFTAPTPAVDPAALAFQVEEGETDSQTFTLSNVGGAEAADLEYEIYVVEAGPPGRTNPVPGAASVLSRGGLTITHSASQEILPGFGVNCPTPPTSWWRVFDLSAFDVDQELRVTSVDVGIEAATAATTTVNLYRLDGELVSSNLTLVGTAALEVGAADSLSIATVPIRGTFAADDVLAVEWAAPEAGILLGGNSAGQTGPTYIQAAACGAPEPIDISLTGFNTHWVLNVTGNTGPALVLVSPESGSVEPGGSDEIAVTVDATDAEAGTYEVELLITTNDPNTPTVTVLVTVEVLEGTAAEQDGDVPTAFALDQNYPNPFGAGTTIRYALPEPAHVTLEVYDAVGRRIAVLVDGDRRPGYYEASWGTGHLASGVYFYRLQAGVYTRTLRMSLVR